MANYLWAIPLLPLFGAILNGIGALTGKLSRHVVHVVACTVVLLSFVLSCATFLELRGMVGHEAHGAGAMLEQVAFTWIQAGSFQVDAALMVDPLSAIMILVITGIGFLIHLYSTGYMAEEPCYARYFAYLNLFTFSMLMLVMGENMLMMFVGWEGVGVCSYLLIGFWYDNVNFANAGMKAFVVNRIGDFGFILGIFLLYWTMTGMGLEATLSFPDLKAALSTHPLSAGMATAVCLLFFVGATGKSAQIPLYIWLPDAMAGPTPVSALIHAATMVTAGVYMVIRMNFLYLMSPTAMTVVAVVGGLTALFAATIGFTQNDIKKVLAYSTVSQLGYMFLAVGVGAWAAGLFHLVTHAFFKACLFLGSGSVIHAMHHEQDMRKMGGLRKFMPVTFGTFAVATCAISGFVPFSGFFSKDEILAKALTADPHLTLVPGSVLYALGVLAALCTTFYMWRLVSLTFFGEHRGVAGHAEHAHHHDHDHDHDHSHAHAHDAHTHAQDAHGHATHGHTPHESPWTMTLPLVVLAFFSLVAGAMNISELFGGNAWLHHWLAAGGVLAGEPSWHHVEHSTEFLLMGIIQVAVLGIAIVAARRYATRAAVPAPDAELRGGLLYRLSVNKYYVDEIYQAIVIKPLVSFSRKVLWRIVDAGLIDGVVNGVASLVGVGSRALGRVQTGEINTYALSMVVGSVIILGWLTL